MLPFDSIKAGDHFNRKWQGLCRELKWEPNAGIG
jgi:hypothetical protein